MEAIESYQHALDVNPNFVIAKDNMAIALTDLGTEYKEKGDIKVYYLILMFLSRWEYRIIKRRYIITVAILMLITILVLLIQRLITLKKQRQLMNLA